MRRLNERLGMAHTFIHDRYGSKDAFWRAVMGSAVGHVRDEVEAALDGEQPGDDLAWLTASERALHQAAARRPRLARVVDYEAARNSSRLTFLHTLMGPLDDAVRPVVERLVRAGTLRDVPWYLFYFAIIKPLAIYSQAPLARLFGRPDDADDHTLLSAVALNGLLT
ncbi:MAG: putative TetR family regulator [Pseudonocardia sp.]|nr:putative TetR family regulator [Pseudonocardia sp.]